MNSRASEAQAVWNHYIARWKENSGRGPTPKFTYRRQIMLRQRLSDFDEPTLVHAINAAFSDEFLLANGHVNPENIFKTVETVEKRLSRLQPEHVRLTRHETSESYDRRTAHMVLGQGSSLTVDTVTPEAAALIVVHGGSVTPEARLEHDRAALFGRTGPVHVVRLPQGTVAVPGHGDKREDAYALLLVLPGGVHLEALAHEIDDPIELHPIPRSVMEEVAP